VVYFSFGTMVFSCFVSFGYRKRGYDLLKEKLVFCAVDCNKELKEENR
jgi:hypothetical protein